MSVSDLFLPIYGRDRFGWTIVKDHKFNKKIKLPCITIFGPGQQNYLDKLKKKLPKNMRIVFESKKAVNNRQGHHYPRQRNTLIVLDKVEEQALPEMP